jgi:hypothetical protein
MLHVNLVVIVCLAYVLLLFGVAFAGDRRARRDPSSGRPSSSPAGGFSCASW